MGQDIADPTNMTDRHHQPLARTGMKDPIHQAHRLQTTTVLKAQLPPPLTTVLGAQTSLSVATGPVLDVVGGEAAAAEVIVADITTAVHHLVGGPRVTST